MISLRPINYYYSNYLIITIIIIIDIIIIIIIIIIIMIIFTDIDNIFTRSADVNDGYRSCFAAVVF